MMVGYVRLAGFISLVFAVHLAIAQTSPYHQLSAEEFEGAPILNSKDVIAYTNCFIDFNYRAKSE